MSNMMRISFDEFNELNEELQFFSKEDALLYYESIYIESYDIAFTLLYEKFKSMGLLTLNRPMLNHVKKRAFKAGGFFNEDIYGSLLDKRLDDFIIPSKIFSTNSENGYASFLLCDMLDYRGGNSIYGVKLYEVYTILLYMVKRDRKRFNKIVNEVIDHYINLKDDRDISKILSHSIDFFYIWNFFNEYWDTADMEIKYFREMTVIINERYSTHIWHAIGFIKSVMSMDLMEFSLSKAHLYNLAKKGKYGLAQLIEWFSAAKDYEFIRLIDIVNDDSMYGKRVFIRTRA